MKKCKWFLVRYNLQAANEWSLSNEVTDPAIVALLEQWHALDIELYQWIARRFQKQVLKCPHARFSMNDGDGYAPNSTRQ